MKRTVIVRVTETEFETEDGRIYPHPIPFPPGEAPSIEELQRQHDRWSKILGDLEDPVPARDDDADG